jgi:hypothetical protein
MEAQRSMTFKDVLIISLHERCLEEKLRIIIRFLIPIGPLSIYRRQLEVLAIFHAVNFHCDFLKLFLKV